jgi:hypothetical protein
MEDDDVLFEIVEGTTEKVGPFKAWEQVEPEPLPLGQTSPEILPVAKDLTGKSIALILRKPDGTLITITGTATPYADQVNFKGWFDFTPGANDFPFITTNNFTRVTHLPGHWEFTTIATGKVSYWPSTDFIVAVRRK